MLAFLYLQKHNYFSEALKKGKISEVSHDLYAIFFAEI